MTAFFVTATDTDVGKTVFCAALVRALDGCYWKPIQAGIEGGTDSERVAALSGLPAERILPEAYRLATPCSPHHAAALDGVTIDPDALAIPRTDRPLVVEGAGGALTPMTRDCLYADLAARWALPTIIVARTRLGTINHSLLTIEALRARGVPLLGVAFVGDAEPVAEDAIAAIGGVRRLGRLAQLPVLGPRELAEAFAAGFDLADFAP